jgi:hypothetical protein
MTMVEERAIGIVSKYGISQRGVKVSAMDLMIGSAESLDIISSACPDFYYLACLEMTYQVRFDGPGFFGDPFANAKEVERMHCVRRNYYTCSNLAKFPRLLENRNAIAEMLQCKRRAQTTNTPSHYGYSRDFHRTRLQCARLKKRLNPPLRDAVQRSWLRQSNRAHSGQYRFLPLARQTSAASLRVISF